MACSLLTLGPLFFHWPVEKRRDFYARIADEAPVDVVYLGEVVCSKRAPFFDPYIEETASRLCRAGKEVVISSLALVTLPRELDALREAASGSYLVEANDVAALRALDGKPFVAGPFINVMNEGTMDAVVAQGAKRIVFASELTGTSIATLAGRVPTVEKEVQVFGRQPLAVSMRCYHARAHGRDKDHCRYACEGDPDGMEAQTLAGQKLLAINGTQTLSHGYLVLLDEIHEMAQAGVTHFRLSPHDTDMNKVAELYRAVMDKKMQADEAQAAFSALLPGISFINGYYHGREGLALVT